MRQIDRLIENLEQQYGISVDKFLRLYEEGAKLSTMAETFGTTQWAIRAVASALNLRLGKKHRPNDLILFYTRRGAEADDRLVGEIQELQQSLEQLSKDLLAKDQALLRERARIRSYKQMERTLTKQQDILSAVEDIVEQGVQPYTPMLLPSLKALPTATERMTQFIMLSDLHADSLVTEAEVGQANEYSWEIMIERLSKVFEAAVKRRSDADTSIHIYLLGDLISGIIHGALETASKHPVEAVAVLSELLSKHIEYLLLCGYENISIFALSGNHERMTDEIKSGNKGFDLGYLLHTLIAAKLSLYDNIKMSITTTGLIAAQIGEDGYPVYAGLHHGDQFRGATGDLNRALRVKEAFRQQGYNVRHLIQGHTHSPKVTALPTEGMEIVNGSLIGTNQYSHTNGFIGIPWSQTIGKWDKFGNLYELSVVGE